ncbi:hypothetical protein crov178 [Cafeteria roenbergensis virus]|uniref:Uncharacterized protein n=1 Tax=Cafeteria roenbergensis virus (strain BV-PW1) TaxID=693272 RepID=E3T4U8_CROVB|nr:hypothetical protein crov178 [Cafeteria roenbergensis virus BV-PW1]ADO67211.1 hypothetical protein crov178 [Cafeteria roenbergensis virus BV-PW1]
MDGGLLQLIAKGVEDMPFINKPEITHFKKIYRKTGIFSIMDSEVILDDLAFEKIKLSKIPKVGDLISKVYLELTIPDFKVNKIQSQNYTKDIFKDINYYTKMNILKKFLEIENTQELHIDDTTLIKLSPYSSGKNILLSKINQINNEYTLEFPIENYKIISYLLTSNLKDEDIILADFILRFLDISNEIVLTSTEYLTNKYNSIYQNLITNYFTNISFQNPEKYQLTEEILQELTKYLVEDVKNNEFQIIGQYNEDPIDFIKNKFVYEAEILTNLIKLIFPTDNFRKGFLKDQIILPFFIYLNYDVNNNNKIIYDLTDTKLISSNFIKDNVSKLQNKVIINTPLTNIIQSTFEKIKVESENYFKSVNYQKMLGNNPEEILSILIAITEIWKWKSYDFDKKTEWQLIPGLEILNLTQVEGNTLTEYISSVSFFKDLEGTNFEKIIQEHITLDFERKKKISNDELFFDSQYHNLEKIIDLVKSKIPSIKPFNLSTLSLNSSYLNRTAIDLSLILVYISYLFRNKLLNNSFLKKELSHSWVNFLNETICSKFYTKWFSEFTSRIDETYVGPETYLESNGESNIKLDNKIPLVIFPNNTYNITSVSIKNLIKLQTHKFNYYLNIVPNSTYTPAPEPDPGPEPAQMVQKSIKTIKKIINLQYSLLSENKKTFVVIENNLINIWYHSFTNEYYLLTDNFNFNLTFYSIKNNKIYFQIKDNINKLNLNNVKYLKIIIQQKINYLNENIQNVTPTLITSNISFTDKELTNLYFYKILYDDLNNIIDILYIPTRFIIKNNNEISSSFTLENEPQYSYSEIKYINQLELPNFLNNFDFTGNYLTFTKLESTSIGNNGDSNTSSEDKYRYNSHLHQDSFILGNGIDADNLYIYHLPYKINSQIYNGIIIKCETYLNDQLIEIKGRFSNKFNLREKINDDTLHIYSEGIDYFDDNIDYNKINILSINEDDHLNEINNLLQLYYSEIESNYKKIVDAHDLITQNLFKKFVDSLEEIKNLGPIYASFIDNFMKNTNINIDNLKYFQTSSFYDAALWDNNLEITGNTLNYINDWADSKNIAFNNWNIIDFTGTSSNNIFIDNKLTYLPNKIYPENLLSYFNKYNKSILLQIENLENNLDLIENHPKIIKSVLNQNELDFITQKSFSEINQKNYLLETKTMMNTSNLLYIDNNQVNFNNNLITSDVLLDNIHNIKPFKINKHEIDVYPINFYDYAITLNNKLIFLPEDFYDIDNNYTLYFINTSLSSNITYQKITFDYIIFNESINISQIENLSKNNLLVLIDSNGNYLPFGRLTPDFNNPYKYYRLGKTSKNKKLKEKLLFENNLIENYHKLNNVIYINSFNNTTNIITPIYDSLKLPIEYYNNSFTISNNTFNLSTTLKINKFDFIYIIETGKWYMFDENIELNTNNINSNKFFIVRLISNTCKNIDLFENQNEYIFTNITWENLITLSENLNFLEIKDNKIIHNNILSDGDIIYNTTDKTIYQVINYQNNILETSPEIILNDNKEYRFFKNIYFNSGLNNELLSYNINLPHGSYTFELLTSYTFYQLPVVYLPNPWEYRQVKQGDLFYKNNTLELQQNSLITLEGWIYKSRDMWVTFTKSANNWYCINTQNLQIGDFIFNLNKLEKDDYLNDANTYLHNGTIQSQVLGRFGKYYYLSNDITDGEWLVKSYPLHIKPTTTQLQNKLYQVNDDNIIIEKINYPSIQLTSTKFLININSNILSIVSGYDNHQKEVVTFSKSLIYPEQKILIDNKYWTTIKNFETLELTDIFEDLENNEMIIPETTTSKLLTKDNNTFDKLEYLSSIPINESVFCCLIGFDSYYKNMAVFNEKIVLIKNEKNVLTFKFENKSFENKFISIINTEKENLYMTDFYININNKFILNSSYDLNKKEIKCFTNLDSSFDLIANYNLNNIHYWLTTPLNLTTKYIFDTNKSQVKYKINNFNVNLLNSQYLQSINPVIPVNETNTNHIFYSSEIYNISLNYNILTEYSYDNKFIEEYCQINLDYNQVFIKNDYYLLELDTNPLNQMDDKIIYQIIDNKINMGYIIENEDGVFLKFVSKINLNLPFYQKKKHLIYTLHENILPSYDINNYSYEYFHYRIGVESIIQFDSADLNIPLTNIPYSNNIIRISDYLYDADFFTPESYYTKNILNNNIKHYLNNKTLPISQYSDGILAFEGPDPNDPHSLNNITLYKNTFLIKIPDNDFNFEFVKNLNNSFEVYYQTDILVEQIKKPILYEPLIKNELDLQKNLMMEYVIDNYLVTKVIPELHWDKIITLSNNQGINQPDDIFYNNYTYLEDYNKFNNVILTLDLQVKHNKILEIVNEIYYRIPVWIFIDEFKNDPDHYLSKYIETSYQLLFKNNMFYNLDGTEYIPIKIPTYFKISDIGSTLYLEYLIKKENVLNDDNYSIFKELILQKPSHKLGLKLVKTVDFYNFWDKLKTGILSNYQENEIYLTNNVTNLRLNQIYRKKILNLYSDNIYKGTVIENNNTNKLEYHNQDIFEYLVNLTSFENNLEFYQIDFRERNLVLTDFETEFILSKNGKARMKLNKFMLNQGIDLYGKINYSINLINYIGTKYQITVPLNSLPSTNFSVGINSVEIEDIKIIDQTNLIIPYIDLNNINYINILVKTSLKFKKGKYYFLNDAVVNWIDNNTYIKYGNDLLSLNINNNEIVTPKPISNNITLCKIVKITSKINLNQYTYQLNLTKEFNNNPSYGYKVKPSDLSINSFTCQNYTFVNNLLYVSFDKELQLQDMKNLVQIFKLNYQNKYKITMNDLNKTIIEYGDENNINLLNEFYLNLTDINNAELGNYIYKVNINGNFNGLTTPVYYINNNNLERLGNLLDGYLITINYINPNNIVVFELNNNNLLELTDLEFIYKNYYKINDLSLSFINLIPNISNIDLTKFNLNLEEELVEEDIKNSIIIKCENLLEDLKETKQYEKYEEFIIKEEPVYKENFGYDILESFQVKLHNTQIEKFDNKMFKEYCYYFLKPEKIKNLNKMLNNPKQIIIPLPFWFCRNWSNSLPIVIANESQFYIEFNFNKLSNILKSETNDKIINKPKIKGKLVYQSIWLGDEEKMLIGKHKQDYLIETFQKSQIEIITSIYKTIDLKVLGSVKDFFFSFYLDDKLINYIEDKVIIDPLYLKYHELIKLPDNNIKYIVDSDNFTNIYNDILNRFTPYFKDKYYVGFIILNYLEKFPLSSKNKLVLFICYYWKDVYLKTKTTKYYPLKNASLNINSYQYIRNKSDLFWSVKNQQNYCKSGDKGLYGLSYSLYPLEQQPSGYLNHTLINSTLLVELNRDYLNMVKNIKGTINMNLFYRRYRLIRFMGNQSGILW